MPGAPQLLDNLRQAADGLNIRSDRLQPFLSDVEAARHAPLITARDLQGTSLRAGFDALILHERSRWNALLPLHPAGLGQTVDTARVAAALHDAQLGSAQVLDLKQESDALYARYLTEAIHLSLAGVLAIGVLLLIALRSARRVAGVLAPLLLAVLNVAAGLALCGVQLTILHLVGMLLIVAVGSNYALFFDRQATLHEAGSESADSGLPRHRQCQHGDRLRSSVILAGTRARGLGHHGGAGRLSGAAIRRGARARRRIGCGLLACVALPCPRARWPPLPRAWCGCPAPTTPRRIS